VALKSQLDLVGGDAVAVIRDQDAVGAAALDLDLDVAGAGVQRVLDQLLHHRRGALDDLPGGDLRRQVRVHDPDTRHRRWLSCWRRNSSA
jgi:hypothetical protein